MHCDRQDGRENDAEFDRMRCRTGDAGKAAAFGAADFLVHHQTRNADNRMHSETREELEDPSEGNDGRERQGAVHFEVTVTVRPKAGLRDPEGGTILTALHALGYDAVGAVHVGRRLVLEVDAAYEAAALALADEMCERLLVNPVIEDHSIDVSVPA